MAHGMTSAMDLMMIAMVGGSLVFGGRRLLAAARRALGGPRGATDVSRDEAGD